MGAHLDRAMAPKQSRSELQWERVGFLQQCMAPDAAHPAVHRAVQIRQRSLGTVHVHVMLHVPPMFPAAAASMELWGGVLTG